MLRQKTDRNMTVEVNRKPNVVNLCMFKGECYFKTLKNNGSSHGWKKSLFLCAFEGNCNQKKIMNHIMASRLYGIIK